MCESSSERRSLHSHYLLSSDIPAHSRSRASSLRDGASVTAQKIVDYRMVHGPFASVDDLDAVPGIGPTRIEQLRDLVTP